MSDWEAGAADDRARRLLMAGLDGELAAAEAKELESLLAADPTLRDEWNRLVRLKEVTDTMKLREPPDQVWQDYWASIYARLERGIGWILFSVGAIVLISYGAWKGAQQLFADTTMPLFLKAAIAATIVGVVVLVVSVVREKLFMRSAERYKDVQR